MHVKTQPDELLDYFTDASNMPGGHAYRLYLPESASDVAEIMTNAANDRIGVTVSGARTGTVGGAVPFGGAILSLDKLNKIVSIDRESRTAVVEAGVVLADFQEAVDAEGLFYPPDPTEWSCQIGGTVATNASGARSFKYGATRGFVLALEVVLPGGEILDLERGKFVSANGVLRITTREGREIEVRTPTYRLPATRKNTSGYHSSEKLDAVDLFIGSEGTLGVITRVTLRLLKKPDSLFSGIVFFDDERELLRFVDAARSLSFAARESRDAEAIDATLLEYFDEKALRFIAEKFPEVPESAKCAVFFEQETNEANEDALLEKWNDLLERFNADLDHSWFTTTDGDREKMRDFRHSLPVAVNERIVRNKQKKVGTDMAVPDENFPAFLRFYHEKLRESGLEYVIFGHIGDNHLHANMIPKDDAEAERARHLYGRFIAQAIMLGGTISAEHGIGKHKSKYLYVQYGERYVNEMAEVKRAFDPFGILGRGNMFDPAFLA